MNSTGLFENAYREIRDQGSKLPWSSTAVTGLLLYAVVCSALRFRRRDAMAKKYHYPTRASLSKMTNDDAQAIGDYIGQLEFPYLYVTALQFSLFKTYGIPTISKILCDTKQLTTTQHASKRYADTVVIVNEMTSNPPTSTRCIKSIARLNYLHGQHPQILNSDYLYTLAQFIVSPITFINQYEWRSLTETEICAMATLWKGIGDGMNIKYDELKRAKEGWKDGIEFYEDIKEWAEEYEEKFMVPAETNRQTGDETVKLLLCVVPRFLWPYARNALCVVMGEKVRKAMMYDSPPDIYYTLVPIIFTTRRLLLRYLSPPRPYFLRVANLTETPDPRTGRYYYNSYLAHPYYIKPSLYKRYGPEGLLTRVLGGVVPGTNDGTDYSPEGYHMEEVGPTRSKGKGVEKMEEFEKRLRVERVAGCPFGGGVKI